MKINYPKNVQSIRQSSETSSIDSTQQLPTAEWSQVRNGLRCEADSEVETIVCIELIRDHSFHCTSGQEV